MFTFKLSISSGTDEQYSSLVQQLESIDSLCKEAKLMKQQKSKQGERTVALQARDDAAAAAFDFFPESEPEFFEQIETEEGLSSPNTSPSQTLGTTITKKEGATRKRAAQSEMLEYLSQKAQVFYILILKIYYIKLELKLGLDLVINLLCLLSYVILERIQAAKRRD